ncbi:hypothetical protein A2533_00795 [Candidatus Falkowbacteria bacterium RIFOXYD2_FULL_35_9]|uniref:Small ribosomal subunit protein bS21 n=1 Tax=Candidatus Falkowbacteria bacterium RIFOXYC2_FULL_36_12 TaxID=1798002 RepID=A0A1F5T089_9BACT|nr:MAG: hypothetical protein A2300_00190 [Candidatus Falkowbacteria bacterium RIFOXYB2_FULL_35_7]OGF31881.1 MAG: hypothetical protein A2478_05355 [Candidatus Falkowbacteria bacterium RIFOXYC2_FULL_36_12]OGF45817.1 MAG: hypothetical protein A2533_00795 [Candidatus Falkowbacteria bacterium RIFOXYD2_FULL_35_9]
MLEVKRKKGETFESFLRRFNKRLIQSGKILQFKKVQYFKKKTTKNLQKTSALRKMEVRDRREYLKKVGRLPEEDTHNRRH